MKRASSVYRFFVHSIFAVGVTGAVLLMGPLVVAQAHSGFEEIRTVGTLVLLLVPGEVVYQVYSLNW